MIIDKLRAEWAKVNQKNPEHLRRWFTNHPELKNHDHAFIFQKAIDFVKIMKRRAGVQGKGTYIPKESRLPPKAESIVPPPDWRTNLDWLRKAADLYGVRGTARIVGIDCATVCRLFQKLGIKTLGATARVKAHKAKNPCYSSEWCHRHYVTLQLTQEECSRLAGITRHAFTRWLMDFGIPAQTVAFRSERWVSIMMNKLRLMPAVERVSANNSRVAVKYISQKRERYYYNGDPPNPRHGVYKIGQEDGQITKVPLVYHEYGVDTTGKPLHPAHIALSRTDLNKSTLMEQRLAIQSFAAEIRGRGWVRPSFPDEMITSDFDRLMAIDVNELKFADGFQTSGHKLPGVKTMLHFFDCSYLYEAISSHVILFRKLTELLERRCKFNFFNLLIAASRNHLQFMQSLFRKSYFIEPLRRPSLYVAIFKHLNITGRILDLKLGPGARAVACAAAGIKYTTIDTQAFDYAINNGFLDFTNLDYTPYTGEKVDVAVYDGLYPDMEFIMDYLNKAKTLLVYVRAHRRDEMMRFKPRTVINLRNNQNAGLIFVW